MIWTWTDLSFLLLLSKSHNLQLVAMPPKAEVEQKDIDWRDKQLVQDIEEHNADPIDVTLELCTFWNKCPKNPKDKVNREYWSNKIQVSCGSLRLELILRSFFLISYARLSNDRCEREPTTTLSSTIAGSLQVSAPRLRIKLFFKSRPRKNSSHYQRRLRRPLL